ncbi:MAG TPA: PD-(D/E)XK nuclease family protein [bacterium]|jgi:RecB family exonuclease
MTLVPRLCYCGNFPELQSRFIAEVSAQRRANPLAPLRVIVRGHLAGLALKRELAWRGCNYANVQFRTMADVAGELAGQAVAARGLRSLNDVTRDAVMARALELCAPLDYFDRICAREGFRRAAWKTLDGLRSAGMTHAMLREMRDRLTHPLLATLRRKVSDLTAIWQSLEQCMAAHGFIDSAALLELATETAKEEPDAAPLIFYGLTELSELEKRFAAALLKGRAATAYLPYAEGHSCTWVKPLREAFGAWGFEELALDPLPATKTLLVRVQRGLFEEITPGSDVPADEDGSLLVVSAPSREREAEEAVRSVLYSPLADSMPARRTAVLLRESDPYTTLLRSSFAQAGIQGYFHRCRTLGDTPTGRALNRLAALLDGRFRRAVVMEFLLSSPVKWPQDLENALDVIPTAEWNQFSLLAGIVSGRNAWPERLGKLRNRFVLELDHGGEDDEDTQRFRAQRLGSLEAMIRFVKRLWQSLAAVEQCRTWRQAVAALWAALRDVCDMGDDSGALLECLMELAELDDLQAPFTPEALRLRAMSVLSQSARRSDRFQVHEPTVAPMDAATGILFDEVLIPGMVEKEIPKPVSADPLLLDDERKTLQELFASKWGVTIPTHAHEHERERFLFHTALMSARRRAVLFYPRRDEATSRDRLPSTYLLKVIEAATAHAADYAALESFIATTPYGRRIAVSRLRGSDPQRAATVFQYHEARLGEALQARTSDALTYLMADHPFFARGVEADVQRHVIRDFTRFDGMMGDPALQKRFGNWFSAEWPALRARHLEEYARCPFNYFVNRALDVWPVEEPPEVQRITALERTILLREILEDFYRAEKEAGRLPLNGECLTRLRRVADNRFARYERDSSTGVHLLWQIDRDRMHRALTDFVSGEIAEPTAFVPDQFARAFTVHMDGSTPMSFSGILDRIDVAPDGTARVVQYKTGKPQRSKGSSLFAGRMMHLPVIRLAAEMLLGGKVESAADCYVAAGRKVVRTEYTGSDWQSGREDFLRAAATIRILIVQGAFFPFPEKSKCALCRARGACGSGRSTAKWGYDLEQTRGFRSLAEVK